MSQDEPIPPSKFDDLMEQLSRMRGDKDRARILNAAAEGWLFSCEQVIQLITSNHFGSGQCNTAISLYDKLTDPENYESVLASLEYDEDRAEVKEALGLE